MSNNPFENTKHQIRQTYEFIKDIASMDDLEHILYPNRVIEVNIPIKMDDGSVKTFVWYRSQHNDARWPYKWWLRFHQDVNREEVIALSMWMSFKTAVVDLPLWWWKWWVIVNPKNLSDREQEELSRGFVRKVYKYLGPDHDIPAPDVNTDPETMSWMMDEYSKINHIYSPWSFTGKPIATWGSKWRDVATSLWWFFVLEKYLNDKWQSLSGKKVLIQWAWNAGMNMAKFLEEKWATIVGISDSKWSIYNEKWIDIQEIESLKDSWKSVTTYSDSKSLTNEAFLQQEVDIMVLAALENQITIHNADKINASVIVELANGPTTPEADEVLHKNWTEVLPDILANAWGVTVSYFEQVQNSTNFYWDLDEVNEKLKKIMTNATQSVVDESIKNNTHFRNWAYIIALKRIVETMKYRGEI